MLTSCYPVLMSADVAGTAGWYLRTLGFTTSYDSDWYVSLRLGNHELALVSFDHPTVPVGYRTPTRGLLVNLEVDGVDDVHRRVVDRGADIVLGLRDEDFGQRHFIVAAPEGVLVDVIQPIEPTAELAGSYVPE